MHDDFAFWNTHSPFQRRQHWLRHAYALDWLEYPPDLEDEVRILGATCGPVAFAVISGKALSEAVTCFPAFEAGRWTSRTEMEKALLGAGLSYTRMPGVWPETGLCLIQFTGPWIYQKFAHAALKHTHWVAVLGQYVFDVNWGGWLPQLNWEDTVLSELIASRPRANGWRVLTAYEILVRPQPSSTKRNHAHASSCGRQ